MFLRVFILLLAAFAATGLAGATPRQFTRLFDGQCSAHAIFILTPPYATPPVPAARIAQPCANSIAFSAGGIMAVAGGSIGKNLFVRLFRPPYSAASVPFVTFVPRRLAHPRGAAFDRDGDLWVTDDESNGVFEFRPPFSSKTQAAAMLRVATQPIDVDVDPTTKLMAVTDVGGDRMCKKTACRVYLLKPPYVGKPSVTWTFAHFQPYAAAFDSSGRLFVEIDRSKTTADINVYGPPFTTGEKPAFVLHPGAPVRTLAFDPRGNLFGQLLETGGLVEFAAPNDGNRAAPTATYGCPKGFPCASHGWAGLAFGP